MIKARIISMFQPGLLLAALSSPAQAVSLQACSIAEATVQRLRSPPKIIRSPSISVTSGRKGIVVGNDIPLFNQGPVSARPLTIRAIGLAAPPKPPGNFWFVHPKVTITKTGDIHLFWGEPHSVSGLTNSDYGGLRMRSIWHSRFRMKSGWSVPQQVIAAESYIQWGDAWPNVISTPDGVETAVGYSRRGAGVIAYITVQDTKVQVSEVAVSLALYTHVSAHGAYRYLANIGPFPGGSGNSVSIFRSSDHGRTWGAALPVGTSGIATRVQAFPHSPDSVRVVWTHGDRSAFGTALRVAEVNFSKQKAALLGEWKAPSGWANAKAVLGPCRTVFVFFEQWRSESEEAQLGLVTWNSSWSKPVMLLPKYRILEIAPSSTSDAIYLALSGAPRSAKLGLETFSPMLIRFAQQ